MSLASSRNQLSEYAETIGGLVVLRCHQKKEKPEKGRACSALQLIGFTLASLHMHRQTGDSVPWARESSHGKLDRPEEASACFSVDEGMCVMDASGRSPEKHASTVFPMDRQKRRAFASAQSRRCRLDGPGQLRMTATEDERREREKVTALQTVVASIRRATSGEGNASATPR